MSNSSEGKNASNTGVKPTNHLVNPRKGSCLMTSGRTGPGWTRLTSLGAPRVPSKSKRILASFSPALACPSKDRPARGTIGDVRSILDQPGPAYQPGAPPRKAPNKNFAKIASFFGGGARTHHLIPSPNTSGTSGGLIPYQQDDRQRNAVGPGNHRLGLLARS